MSIKLEILFSFTGKTFLNAGLRFLATHVLPLRQYCNLYCTTALHVKNFLYF